MKMQIVPRSKLYLTALSILLVVLLLLVFISVSTYRNLDRERSAALKTVRRQALTLINALEAGARAGMMLQMTGEDVIGNLIHEIGRSEDIHYIYLVNENGEVVHHSTPSLEGSQTKWRPHFKSPTEIVSRMRRIDDGNRVYDLAKPFKPMNSKEISIQSGRFAKPADDQGTFHVRATIHLGMNMNNYETARKADLHHAAIMGGIVLALGGGVIYFFIVLRSYYLLNRTLQKARDYTSQVIASMVHGVLSIDTDGLVVSHNKQALALLGIKGAAAVGFDLRTTLDFEKTGITDTLASGIPVLSFEMDFSRPSGDLIPLLLTVTPIESETGKRSGAVVVIRDMSAIKELEEQMRRTEKLAAIGKLAAGVAHEIRNPLSSIRGFAYLLGKNFGSRTREREYADVMVSEIDRINHVVTNLLNYARPMKLEAESTRLETLIDHVISLVSADAKKQCIDIHFEAESRLPLMDVDPNQVTQALLNLLLNALYVLEEGKTVEIFAVYVIDDKSVAISVEDNGPGILPDLQKQIFDPFYTTRAQGTGLGLSMVRKIAESHKGRIEVFSPPPGKTTGSRFTLSLKSVGSEVDP